MAACLVCGRPVGFTRKRAATHAHDVYVALAALRIAEAAIGDELDAEPFLRIVGEGQTLMETMHEWAHTRRRPDPMDARTMLNRLARWRRIVHMFIHAWASYDRTSFQEHCTSLPQREARLVRSLASSVA
jgi:hypothetical protein